MKKLFTITAVVAAIALSAQSNASVNVSIELKDVLAISASESNVVLTYNTIADYRDGVKVLKENHITASSTGSYKITSTVAADNLITQSKLPTSLKA